MAVLAALKDLNGQLLDAKIAALATAVATAPAGSALAVSFASARDQAQIETVDHYMRVGRISAALILSTLS